MVLETIKVQLELLTNKFTGPMKDAENKMKEFNKQAFKQGANLRNMSSNQKVAGTQMKAFGMQNSKFGQVMNMSMENWKSFNQQGFRFTTMGGRAANGLRNLTHGMRGFQMAALGVMFFGMSLVRMFKQLFGPISKAFGISELFGLMLTMVFLPIMQAIFPYLLKFMTWFMNLSPGVKRAIGIFVILVGVFGVILTIIGTFILGIGSLILMWPLLAGAATTAIAALSAVFLPILAIIAIVIAIVIGMKTAWDENFLGMKDIITNFISGFKELFSGIIMFFSGFFLILKGLFTGNWKLIWEGVVKVFVGAIKIIHGLVTMLVSGMKAILVGIIKIVFNIIKAVIDLFINLPGKIWDAIKGVGALIAKAFTDNVPSWIIKLIKGGSSFIRGLFSSGSGSSGPSQQENDFIWRPGQGAVGINPNDTLVGFKGSAPDLQGGNSSGGSVTNNFYGFTMEDLQRELDERDRQLVTQMERNR